MSEESRHGLLLVDKPAGWTSHDLVDWARKIFKTRSIGHCGTLDPMASGLMVLLVGEATKLSNYILEKDKAYEVSIQLGLTTDTLDTTGAVLTKADSLDLTKKQIQEMAIMLQGEFQLPVPMYSAVKIGGTKLHEFARKGEKIEQPMKVMKFWDFEVKSLELDQIVLHMQCSKGSYVRAWVHEFGQKLGCGAAMSGLIRTGSAPYTLKEAHQVEEVEKKSNFDELSFCLIKMTDALPEYRAIRVQPQDEGMLLNGQISNGLKSQLISLFKPQQSNFKAISSTTNKLLALIGLDEDRGFVIRRGFRY